MKLCICHADQDAAAAEVHGLIMRSGPRPGTALRAIPSPHYREQPQHSFCGHCGVVPEGVALAGSRVCGSCGLGLVLQAAADVAPRPHDSFVVIDGALTVSALSAAAESLLGVTEKEAVGRPISELLTAADVEERGDDQVARHIIAAADEVQGPSHQVVLRPAGEFGVRLWARIGPCGPPRAALLVFADRS